MTMERARTLVSTSVTTGVVLRPTGVASVSRLAARSPHVTLVIEPWALEGQLERLVDRPVIRPVAMEPTLDLNNSAARGWLRLLKLFAAGLHDGTSVVDTPLIAEPLCQALINGLLSISGHPYRELLDHAVAPSRPVTVKRAMDAMHSHPEFPHSLSGLADLVGVSVRTLQEGFRQHVGVPTMAYLRQLRLARAHEDLLEGRVHTVAEAAYRWGFGHLGRFAGAYRVRYGVKPSETLFAARGGRASLPVIATTQAGSAKGSGPLPDEYGHDPGGGPFRTLAQS